VVSAATCRYCGAAIDWHRTPAGKWQPLELEPAANTTVGPERPGSVVVGARSPTRCRRGAASSRAKRCAFRTRRSARHGGTTGRAADRTSPTTATSSSTPKPCRPLSATRRRQHANALRLEASRLRSCADALDRLADAVEAL
jgi:hypothetical protein